jgi:hypothetical protein
MEVDLSKQFLSACKHDVHVIVDFLVVCNLVVNHTRIGNYALVTNLGSVDFRVHQISVQVVKFVQVKRTPMVGHYVE